MPRPAEACAAGGRAAAGRSAVYVEDSGTSMAAPHVSGAIAAFLSVRREFIGKPEAVKEIFLSTATDLKRERYSRATVSWISCAPSNPSRHIVGSAMDSIAGIPFFPLEITKEGRIFDPAQKAVIENAVRDAGAGKLTDLFVISHGWNNDMAEARALYEGLFANLIALRPRHNELADRKFGVVGIFWPSKKFADSELIPAGGAAGLDGDGGLDSSVLEQRLESLKDFFDKPDEAPLERAKALVDGIEDSVSKQQEFVKIIHALMPAPSDHVDDAAMPFVLTASPSHEVLEILGRPWLPTAAAGAGGGALDLNDQVGGAASFGDFFSGIKAGALRLLNYATYYQMKERAGVVGGALNGVLGPVRSMRPDLRLHLIGHSFGARVVTSAVDGQAAIRPSSLTLLQGAFSIMGLRKNSTARRTASSVR